MSQEDKVILYRGNRFEKLSQKSEFADEVLWIYKGANAWQEKRVHAFQREPFFNCLLPLQILVGAIGFEPTTL